jgi:hypothetical protein
MTFHPFVRVSRKTFVWSAIALMVLSPLTLFVFENFPRLLAYARYFNWGVACALIVLSMGRLADAGYSRWVGFAGVFGPIVAVPSLTTLVAILAFKIPSATVLANAIYILAAAITLLLAFLIWAAWLPSDNRTDFDRDYGSRDDYPPHDRIEPRF